MECVISDNAVTQKSLIGKSVKIVTIDKEIHEGLIHVIDPVSKTVILLSDSQKTLEVFMPHAIFSIEIIHEENNLPLPINFYNNTLLFDSDIEERKVRLKNWFKKNLIDVTEDGSTLKIQNSFQITPPYTIDQCVCSNKQVLERMISLIERMP